MAWIESHQSLARHKKTMRLASLLRCDRHKIIGHLHELWWWAVDNVPINGDLGDASVEEVGIAAGWPIETAADFTEAAITARFIDRAADGHLSLHDWQDYAGKLMDQRELRKASNRNAQKRRRQRMSSPVSADVSADSKSMSSPVSTLPNPTKPNPTKPNPTKEKITTTGSEFIAALFEAFDANGFAPPKRAVLDDATAFEADWIVRWHHPPPRDAAGFAVAEAARASARRWDYVLTVLQRLLESGRVEPLPKREAVNGHGGFSGSGRDSAKPARGGDGWDRARAAAGEAGL